MGRADPQHIDHETDRVAADVASARRIISGDVPEWHRFVEAYSGLIEATLTRRLRGETRETIHNLYVDILHDVYRRSLKKYDGRSRLSTWLVMHTSARATDFLRSNGGRQRLPQSVACMGTLEQKVYQHFFLDRIPLTAMVPLLNWHHEEYSLERIVEAIQCVVDAVPPRTLRRITDDARSRAEHSESLRQVSFYAEARERYRRAALMQEPDVIYARREAERMVETIERFKGTLSDEERRVFELRFDEELSAEDVARELAIPGRRRVYTIAERVVRRLRRFLHAEGVRPEPSADE